MRPLTIDDVFEAKVINDVQVSPDGELVAFVVADQYKEGAASVRSQIWMAATAGGSPRVFTTGSGADHSPRWSPDGQWLAFLSNRSNSDGRAELYVIARQGGEARRLFESKVGISAGTYGLPLAWSPDSARIAFLMVDPPTDEEKRLKDAKVDPILFERDHKFNRVWVVDAAGGQPSCLTPDAQQVWEFDWSPDAAQLALIVSDEPYEWSWYHARLAVAPAGGGPLRTLFDPAPRQIARPVWSPDGGLIAFLQSTWSDRGVTGGELCLADPAQGSVRRLSENYPASINDLQWLPNSRSLVALAARHDGAVLAQWTLDGAQRELWAAEVAVADPFWPRFSADRALRTLAVARESADEPRQVWIGQRDYDSVEWTRLTSFHEQFAEISPARAQHVSWLGASDWPMDGYLLLPENASEGRPVPLFTWVHGGPTSLYQPRFWNSLPMAYYATRGIAVFLPNPRGSTGRGLKFAEANVGDMGGQDFADILGGIESLIRAGLADPERLAIGGWSYGGFMTAWAVTQTTRFRCAVMGAGISNWLSFHGTSRLGEWDRVHYAADPYERGGRFDRFSPMTYIQNVKTPTLIIHGEVDGDVPPTQGYEFFRALKQHNVPVELRVYPREGHGFREKAHQRDWVARAAAWLEKWLMA